jgi:hypothetical protein
VDENPDSKKNTEQSLGSALNNNSDATPPILPKKNSGTQDFFALLISYLILLFGAYGVLSFIAPNFLSELNDNRIGTLGILTFGFVMLGALTRALDNISKTSFVEIDRKARGEFRSAGGELGISVLASLGRRVAESALLPFGIDAVSSKGFIARPAAVDTASEREKSVERTRVLGTAFELYICGVVESLDKHISLTEEKGSNLLDRGLLFLFGGILFYIMAIIAWQIWAKYGEPKDSVMYIGMVASSVVFLVCEFLAAWFLKQYRHYVDASLSCLRVKSVYDRYLLSYYAVKEIDLEEAGVSSKLSCVLEAIKEDVMWPGHKENVSNDFNYMLESMSSVHASLDKLKGLFDSKAKPETGAAN